METETKYKSKPNRLREYNTTIAVRQDIRKMLKDVRSEMEGVLPPGLRLNTNSTIALLVDFWKTWYPKLRRNQISGGDDL
jgi:alpha-L-arabinofuranosidase